MFEEVSFEDSIAFFRLNKLIFFFLFRQHFSFLGRKRKVGLRLPGFEPGSQDWQPRVIGQTTLQPRFFCLLFILLCFCATERLASVALLINLS